MRYGGCLFAALVGCTPSVQQACSADDYDARLSFDEQSARVSTQCARALGGASRLDWQSFRISPTDHNEHAVVTSLFLLWAAYGQPTCFPARF